ncbi:MAG TPA: hypothetical protein VKV28_10270 [Candidatus Binataceae bacterium]|nr:hypothetical protein [Candidatus Binataceae bacterium]
MVASARIARYARNAMRWGVRYGPVEVDMAAVVACKQRIVAR